MVETTTNAVAENNVNIIQKAKAARMINGSTVKWGADLNNETDAHLAGPQRSLTDYSSGMFLAAFLRSA